MPSTVARRSRPALAAALGLLLTASAAVAAGDWNDAGVAWKAHDAGLEEARGSGRPVLLVFYTDWCPHCTTYSRVFHDQAVVALSGKFVMIRINKDQDPATSAKYAPDGEYIPRTFFLKSDGTLLADVTERRPNYKYFYDTSDPAALLRSMRKVLGEPGEPAT